jgi:hypothetical protein
LRKTKFKILLLVIQIILISCSYSQTIDLKERFSIGLVGWFIDPLYTHNNYHSEWIKELGVDVLISYSQRNDYSNIYFGGFYDNLDKYKAEVLTALNSAYPDYTYKIFERAKIIRPAYGQRSTYQAEPMSDNAFPEYYYAEHETGEYYEENFKDEVVKGWKCETGKSYSKGYMVKGLIENCEQVQHFDSTKLTGDLEYAISDYKMPGWKWFVKPRMRIDRTIANDKNRQNEIVVTLEIVNFAGDSPASSGYSIPVTVSNFRKDSLYDGSYTELIFDKGSVKELIAFASYLCKGRNTKALEDSRVDFRIYWNGTIPVYLDYVRVDDEWAHYLFEPQLDKEKKYDFIGKINEEVDAFGDKLSYFYMDECPVNSFACIGEVNRLIKKRSKRDNTGIFAILMKETAMQHYGYLKKQPDDEQYIKYILSVPEFMTDIFLYTSYPFKDSSKYPSNLNLVQKSPDYIDYYRGDNPADYNFDLINKTLGNDYRANAQAMNSYRLFGKFIRESTEKGRKILPAYFIQIHSWETHAARWKRNTYILREPTNEEILLQGNLALVYGAKSIYFFAHNTDKITSPLNGKDYYDYGLFDDAEGRIRRTENYFGQNKWNGIKEITAKLKQIGNVMYPLGEISKHLIYEGSFSVNTIVKDNIRTGNIINGFSYKYIENIRSVYPSNSSYNLTEPDCSNCDPDALKYWEFGFFAPNTLNKPDEKCHFFMALNKRCTPVLNGMDDDVRTLKIKFRPEELGSAEEWKILDAVTKDIIATFNKYSGVYIEIGIFRPAEARLFKLIPIDK